MSEKLPAQIERIETEIADMHQKMADPAFYKQDGKVIAAHGQQLAELEEDLAKYFARWEELESVV